MFYEHRLYVPVYTGHASYVRIVRLVSNYTINFIEWKKESLIFS